MTSNRLIRYRVLVLAGVLALVGQAEALAQFLPMPGQGSSPPQSSPFPPAPGQGSAPQSGQSSPFPPAPGQGASQAGQPGGSLPASHPQSVCLTFPPIREDAQKGATAIQAASDRKAAREEVCPLFKSFAAREAKLVKFLVTHQVTCGVPPQAVKDARANHARTLQIRNQVCSAAPAAAGPSLSDALGGPVIADDTSVKPGRGTFDTLTGNALAR